MQAQISADIETACLYVCGFCNFYLCMLVQICNINRSYKVRIHNFVRYKISDSLVRSEFRRSLKSMHVHFESHTIVLILKSLSLSITACSLSPALLSQMNRLYETSFPSDISSTIHKIN